MGLEWLFDFRQAYVWLCEVHLIQDHGRACGVQYLCQPMHIWWICNAFNSRRGNILVCMLWTHKGHDCPLWVAPRLIWVYWNVKDPNTTCQYYEGFLMGGNLTVCYFWMGESFSLVKWKLPVWSGGFAWGWRYYLETWSVYQWYGGTMQKFIYRIGPTWCGECGIAWGRLWIVVDFEFWYSGK